MMNYNKMFTLDKEDIDAIDEMQAPEVVEVTELPEEPVEVSETIQEPQPRYLMGKVNCSALYVREAPYADAKDVGKIKRDCEVMIDESLSTEDFYSVAISSGIEGFCMKQFITIE